MELENIVANTVLLKAREGKDGDSSALMTRGQGAHTVQRATTGPVLGPR